MKSILEELYKGNICPSEEIITKKSDISNILVIWKKKLSEDEYKQLKILLDLRFQVCVMENSIYKEIEKLSQELNSAITTEEDICNNKIIELSQRLDKVIVKYIKAENPF